MSNWTDERIERLKVRWAAGDSAAEIAKYFGMSRNAVLGKIGRLGLPPPPRREFWTDKSVERLKALWPEMSATKIGVELCVSRNAVFRKARSLNLHRKTAEERVQNIRRGMPKSRPTQNLAAVNAVRRAQSAAGPDMAAVHKLQEVPSTARPWTTRRFGECAFPVAGLGADTASCCGPTGGETYCAGHRAIMYAKPATPAQRAHMAKMRAARRKAA